MDQQKLFHEKAGRKIFLVDDHPMLREGLKRLIEQIPDCAICGEAETASDAMAAITELCPDLVIMDISLPDRNGLELLKDMRSQMQDMRILVFSMHDEMLYAERTLKAGALGYLMKGADSTLVVEAVTRTLEDGIYVSPKVSNLLLKGISGGMARKTGLEKLSDRELEILEQIGRCRSSGEISELLHISPKTVDAHRANIRAKLELPDAQSLLREAVLWVERASEPRKDRDTDFLP